MTLLRIRAFNVSMLHSEAQQSLGQDMQASVTRCSRYYETASAQQTGSVRDIVFKRLSYPR